MPAWRLYLLVVGTLGIFVPFWTYRTARRLDEGRSRRLHHVAWATTWLCPPIFALVLYEFARLTNAEGRKGLRSFGGNPWAPAAWHVGLALLLLMTPLGSLTSLFWWVLPLPMLMIQANLRLLWQVRPHQNEESSGDEAVPAPTRSLFRSALPVLALPLSLAVSYFVDWEAARTLMRAKLRAGSAVMGKSALFTLKLPDDRWIQHEPGTFGDADADMELARPSRGTWLVGYVHKMRVASLDPVVASRRQVIAADFSIRDQRENRRFLDPESLAPLSEATYRPGGLLVQGGYRVSTVRLADKVIELVTFSENWSAEETTLSELLGSLRLQTGGQP